MSQRVLWILFCSLLTTVCGVNDCLPSREAYVNLGLGDAEDVPTEFVSGIDAQICTVTSMTCCPLEVERSIDDAAFENTRDMIPLYSLYLNESDRVFFPNYGYVTDVVIGAIREYFELSVPPSSSDIRSALNRVIQQLNNIHNNNQGSKFDDRMKDLFSYTYLERMRGLYNLGPENDYNNTFTKCALPIIEQRQINDEILSAIDVIANHFRALFYFREILYHIHILFVDLEHNIPFSQCIRSFAELFYCHICMPETSSLVPCKNVCKNVLSGCTIFLHVTGEEIVEPLRALCQLNTITTHPSWNLHTALEVINNNLYSIFDTSIAELLQIASSISSCSEAPVLASSPAPTDNLNRTTTGRAELLSSVPTSLTNSLHYTLFTNLSSVFLNFENITQNILEKECGSLPEDDGSNDFECWHRLSSSTDDVDYLGIDFQAVLYNNQDLPPPNMMFVNDFNTSVDNLKDGTTAAMGFIENDIPDDLRVNTDHCNLPLEQLLLPPPDVPTTTTTTTTNITPTPRIESTDNGSGQTGFNAMLLLFLTILLLILIH